MQLEWKARVLEALKEALRVVATRRSKGAPRGGVRGYRWNSENPEQTCVVLDELEVEAVTTIILYRVVLQMRSDLRGHPNYQKVCQVLEEIPLWSLDREIAIEVIDCLSSILGLPFRHCSRIESDGVFYPVDQVMKQKIQIAAELLGLTLL